MRPDSNNGKEILAIEAWGKTRTDYSKTGFYSNYFVDKDNLIPSVNFLKQRDYVLEDIAGVDVHEGIMLVYHFDKFDSSDRITLRVLASHDSMKIPSIVSIFKGADWHERECYDFFGVEFLAHPNLKPLLLPDDLNVHPLLKGKDRKSIYALIDFNMLIDNR